MTRVLAIDPSAKGFAFVVLEGSERLIDWGGATVTGKDVSRFLEKLGRLIDRYQPDLLVLEEPAGSNRGERAREWLVWAEELARERELEAVALTQEQVAECFGLPTRYERAEALAKLFPELSSTLPPKRRTFDPEHERMQIFDALAFGVTALRQGGE